MKLPTYTDGRFDLYRIVTDETQDFPKDILQKTNISIWYSEISLFDRVVFELEQGGIQATMKIRIPRYKGIDTKCICVMDGKKHRVYNAAHIVNKNGFEETELTLIKPEQDYEVLHD